MCVASSTFTPLFFIVYVCWSDGMRAAEATGLGFVCFVVSTLMCCQPTELISGFFFVLNFPFLLPPPPVRTQKSVWT